MTQQFAVKQQSYFEDKLTGEELHGSKMFYVGRPNNGTGEYLRNDGKVFNRMQQTVLEPYGTYFLTQQEAQDCLDRYNQQQKANNGFHPTLSRSITLNDIAFLAHSLEQAINLKLDFKIDMTREQMLEQAFNHVTDGAQAVLSYLNTVLEESKIHATKDAANQDTETTTT